MFDNLLSPEHLIILFAIGALIAPFWQIFKKAGFPPALSLLILLPIINVITLWIVAFSKWKVTPVG